MKRIFLFFYCEDAENLVIYKMETSWNKGARGDDKNIANKQYTKAGLLL